MSSHTFSPKCQPDIFLEFKSSSVSLAAFYKNTDLIALSVLRKWARHKKDQIINLWGRQAEAFSILSWDEKRNGLE